jgi:UDP:flavonoid glycosyltransferase YjiC (YdhE family)
MAAGIPTVIKPFFGDQFFWADRVEALGVGSGVRKLTVDNLTDALRTATTDVKQIDRAKLVGEQIRAVSIILMLRNFRSSDTCC